MIVIAVVAFWTMDDMVFCTCLLAVIISTLFNLLGFILGCGVFRILGFRCFSFSVRIFVVFAHVCPTRLSHFHYLCRHLPERSLLWTCPGCSRGFLASFVFWDSSCLLFLCIYERISDLFFLRLVVLFHRSSNDGHHECLPPFSLCTARVWILAYPSSRVCDDPF